MTIMPVVEWVRITDKEMLKKVGCPWTTGTLRNMHYKKKFPGLFSKPGGDSRSNLVMLHVPTLRMILQEGRDWSKQTGG